MTSFECDVLSVLSKNWAPILLILLIFPEIPLKNMHSDIYGGDVMSTRPIRLVSRDSYIYIATSYAESNAPYKDSKFDKR